MRKRVTSLKEKLQTRNIPDTGTWVQCCQSDCKKWRYMSGVQDPSDVPDYWTCRDNPDERYNSCDKPEEEYDESEHILTKYTEGSVVWARMSGYPWWPAMIESDPDSGEYIKREFETSMLPRCYHVVFFDDKVSRAWISPSSLKPFAEIDPSDKKRFTIKGQNYYKAVSRAAELAEQALALSIKERLSKFSFSRRYNGRWGKAMECSDSEESLSKEETGSEPEAEKLDEVDHWSGDEGSSHDDQSVDDDFALEKVAHVINVTEIIVGKEENECTSTHAAKSELKVKKIKKKLPQIETSDSVTVTATNVTERNGEDKVESVLQMKDQAGYDIQLPNEKIKKKKKKRQSSNEIDAKISGEHLPRKKKAKSKNTEAKSSAKFAENENAANKSHCIPTDKDPMESKIPDSTCLELPVVIPQKKKKKNKSLGADPCGEDHTTAAKTSFLSKPKQKTIKKRKPEDMEALGECSPVKKKKKAKKAKALNISGAAPETIGKSDSLCVTPSGEPEKETNGEHAMATVTSQVVHKKKKSTKREGQKVKATVSSEVSSNKKKKVDKPDKEKVKSVESSKVPSKKKDTFAQSDGQKMKTSESGNAPPKKKKKVKSDAVNTETVVASKALPKLMSAATDVQKPAEPGNTVAPKFVSKKKAAKPFQVKPRVDGSKPATAKLDAQTKMGIMPEKTGDGTKNTSPDDDPQRKFQPFKFKQRTALAKSPVLESEPGSPQPPEDSSTEAVETLSVQLKQDMAPEEKRNERSLKCKKEKLGKKTKSPAKKHEEICTEDAKEDPSPAPSSKTSSSPVSISWEEFQSSQELAREQVVPREESSSEEFDLDLELQGYSKVYAPGKVPVSTGKGEESAAEIVGAIEEQLNDEYSSDIDLGMSATVIEKTEIFLPEMSDSDSDLFEF